MSILPKLFYRFNTISIKIPADFFIIIDGDSEMYMKIKRDLSNVEKEQSVTTSAIWFWDFL